MLQKIKEERNRKLKSRRENVDFIVTVKNSANINIYSLKTFSYF